MNKKLVVACIAMAAFGFNADAQKKEKIPPPPPPKQTNVLVNDKKEYDEFLKRNPTVKSVFWKGAGNIMGIRLKSGKEEVYNLENEAEVVAAEAKYGDLPVAPPPPPPVPAKPSKTEVPEILSIAEEPAPPAKAGKPGEYLPTPPKKKNRIPKL